MLRRRRITARLAPTLSTVIRTVHAAFISRPQLSAACAGAEQRRNCGRRLRPAVAYALPTLARETPEQSAIRAAGDIRGVRTGRGRNNDNVRVLRIDRHAPQVADLEPRAGRAPRGAGIVALEISIARGDAQRVGSLGVNGEFMGVPRSTGNAVAPGAAAIDRRNESARFDRDPESFRLAGGTRSSERNECPVSAERTTPMTTPESPIGWFAPT